MINGAPQIVGVVRTGVVVLQSPYVGGAGIDGVGAEALQVGHDAVGRGPL